MFDSIRESATGKIEALDADKVKDQAAVVAAQLAAQAKDAAVHAKDWSAPRVEAFKEWLTPRIERAWDDSVRAAAPQVEKAAKAASPLIDTAHNKLVEEYLPKLVDSFNAAASAASAKAIEAGGAGEALAGRIAKMSDSAADLPNKVAKAAHGKQHGNSKAKAFWWIAGSAVAAGGAYVVWRKSQPEVDPWAEPWEKVDGNTFDDVAREAKDAVGNAAEAVGEAAGATVAKSREVASKVAAKATNVATAATAVVAETISDVVDADKSHTEKDADHVSEAAESTTPLPKGSSPLSEKDKSPAEAMDSKDAQKSAHNASDRAPGTIASADETASVPTPKPIPKAPKKPTAN